MSGEKIRERWRIPQSVAAGNLSSGESVLIPGDEWHPLDGKPAPEYIPDFWDGPHVGKRLVEAFKVLANLPDGGKRGGAPGFWPQIFHDEEDLKAQKEAVVEEPARPRIKPSSAEISRMETVIVWPGCYLFGDAERAIIVQKVAFFRSIDMDMGHVARRLRFANDRALRQINRDGLDAIAAGLRRDKINIF